MDNLGNKTVKQILPIGSTEITFVSDKCGTEILDTHVMINGISLCWIAGDTISEFYNKLTTLINFYKI